MFTVIICFYRCKYVIILEQDSPLNNIVNNLCILIIIELKKGIFNESKTKVHHIKLFAKFECLKFLSCSLCLLDILAKPSNHETCISTQSSHFYLAAWDIPSCHPVQETAVDFLEEPFHKVASCASNSYSYHKF